MHVHEDAVACEIQATSWFEAVDARYFSEHRLGLVHPIPRFSLGVVINVQLDISISLCGLSTSLSQLHTLFLLMDE